MRKTFKKFGMVLSLAACMGMMMTGCGGNNAAETGGEAAETYTIGINQFADHGSLDNCREGFIEGLRQAGALEHCCRSGLFGTLHRLLA